MNTEKKLRLKKKQQLLLPDENHNWIPDSYEKENQSPQFHPADTLDNIPKTSLMDHNHKPIHNLPEGSHHHDNDDHSLNDNSPHSNKSSLRKHAGKDPMYYSVGGSIHAHQSSFRANASKAKARSRNNSGARNKHLHAIQTIEMHGKRVSIPVDPDCDSPYACKIIEIPSDQDITTKKILLVGDREQRYINSQFKPSATHHHPVPTSPAGTSTDGGLRLRSAQNSPNNSIAEGKGSGSVGSGSKSEWMVGPMPLQAWPFQNHSSSKNDHVKISSASDSEPSPNVESDKSASAVSTKTSRKAVKSIIKKFNSVITQESSIPSITSEVKSLSRGFPSSIGVQAQAESEDDDGGVKSTKIKLVNRRNYTDSSTQPEPNLALPESSEQRLVHLGGLAQRLEQTVFSAYEASSVIIQTVFRESLGDPQSLEAVLESPEFQSFLHAPNEVAALRTLSSLFDESSRVIAEYLDSLESAGISFPSQTEFSLKSNQALVAAAKTNALPGTKSTQVAAALKKSKNEIQSSFVYSFVPRPSLSAAPTTSNYSLSLYRNPENGDIIQTIQCGNSIYRTTFSTSPLQSDRIRNLMTASTEHFGLPELPLPERLVDTFIRSASYASSSLMTGKTAFFKCCRDIYRASTSFQDAKYTIASVKSKRSHAALIKRLRELNMYAGMIYQLSLELWTACESMQVGIRKSLEVQEALKFPRVLNSPNTKESSKECQIPTALSGATILFPTTSASSVASVPMQTAMIRLSAGIKGLAHATRMGSFCLESERAAGGIPLTKDHRKVLKEFVGGLKAMGSHKDVEFGCLLMGILCSSELIGKKYCPELDKINANGEGMDSFHRAAIINHLGKINWAMLEIVSSAKRMKNDAYVLTLHTTKRLNEARLKRFHY